ncbi:MULTISPECIES: iron chaperone [Pediococcus]|jgi:uncharacterized protein YdhG (YjbR/CyaY superfamily)|uniref:iron chaperone n=1 Tax=Pediococcus TaxID=1253 RepID=UPI00070B022B|nr:MULTISPECIES: iron chaperone [Pediococcus]MCT3027514.1 iron chaperone [Pediococcus parvulus]MCT3028260.1 iron chaperone [Pediococcus parvulus]MCT3034000.1 iron chaperone [Pediococcus parvulus]MDN5576199.1 iron chaperone [Pediococcus sp.]GEL90147.1 intracellular iron chaperone frataxin [Pediococcus parvulus]
METFTEFIDTIDNSDHQSRVREVLQWVSDTFPQLEKRIAWNQPMFTDHGTFIIGFSVSKKHLAFTPEEAGISHFEDDLKAANIDHTKGIVRMPWDQPFNYELLKQMIEFNIHDKAAIETFWRPAKR